jgi:hypothetical protein
MYYLAEKPKESYVCVFLFQLMHLFDKRNYRKIMNIKMVGNKRMVIGEVRGNIVSVNT